MVQIYNKTIITYSTNVPKMGLREVNRAFFTSILEIFEQLFSPFHKKLLLLGET